MKVTASAPAKVILLGEHFVVYGKPALVLAIDRRAYVSAEIREDEKIYIHSEDLGASGYFYSGTFQVEEGGQTAEMKLKPIETVIRRILTLSNKNVGINVIVTSQIPVAAGLGSSAAVAVATSVAVSNVLGLKLPKDEIFQIAYDAERIIHGTPSGVDPAISTHGGVLLYVRGKGITRLNVETDLPLVIGNTGIIRSTGELVARVREMRKRYPLIINPIIETGGRIVKEAIDLLKNGDLKALGELMNIDHALLSAVGVSNEEIERLVYAAKKAGAYGAKLTGAGGGGCVIALTPQNRLVNVVRAMEEISSESFAAKKTEEGVRVEEETYDP